MHVRFRILEKLQRVTQGQSEGLPPSVVNVEPPAHHRFGSTTISGATCHSPKGWRGVSYAVSLMQWVASTFLPAPKDKINCGDLGTDHLHVSANSHGRLRVTSPSKGQDMTGIYQSSDQGNDVTLEHTRVIRPPIIH